MPGLKPHKYYEVLFIGEKEVIRKRSGRTYFSPKKLIKYMIETYDEIKSKISCGEKFKVRVALMIDGEEEKEWWYTIKPVECKHVIRKSKPIEDEE